VVAGDGKKGQAPAGLVVSLTLLGKGDRRSKVISCECMTL
jgi:hypothetical protein